MKIVKVPQEMQEIALSLREDKRRIALIPTMGALHRGHLSLIEAAKAHPGFDRSRDKIVVSLFVNPIQFNDPKDLQQYPTPIEQDLKLCEENGVDFVFLPSKEAMYPGGFETKVSVPRLSQGLCGESRPGHFDGVATVVLKLFSIVMPSLACFGEKDFQQLAIIRRMVLDLNLPIEIIPCPTVRAEDGLAMSSRNARLSEKARKQAMILYQMIEWAREEFDNGEYSCIKVKREIERRIREAPLATLDYVQLVDTDLLSPLETYDPGRTRLVLAVMVDGVRLIDNALL